MADADTDWTLYDGYLTASDGRQAMKLDGFTNVELRGGSGNNRIEVVSWNGRVTIDGGGEADTIILHAGSGTIVTVLDTGAGDELNILGTDADDKILVTANTIAVFQADSSTPLLYVTYHVGVTTPTGLLRISGGTPPDVYDDGNDVIFGGLGNDWLVGFGSDNARGVFDNIVVQILPPAITLEATEEFPDTHDVLDLVPVSGWWTGSANGERYEGAALNGDPMAVSLVDLGWNKGLEVSSILEFEVTFNTEKAGGVVFDYYGPDKFKFAAIDVLANKIVIGHFTARSGWVTDASFGMTIETGTDYVLHLSLKGTTAGVSVKESGKPNWQGMVGHVFHAVTVDGGFGLLSKDGASSFDQVTIKTNDPAFATSDDGASLEDVMASTTTDSLNSYAVHPYDVNGDGIVSAADVLLVINTVNRRVGTFALVGSAVVPHLDVNGGDTQETQADSDRRKGKLSLDQRLSVC